VTYDPEAKPFLGVIHHSNQNGPAPVFKDEPVAPLCGELLQWDPSWSVQTDLVREPELHGYGGLDRCGLTIDEVGLVTPPAHGVQSGE
jgi:hypothetical protein